MTSCLVAAVVALACLLSSVTAQNLGDPCSSPTKMAPYPGNCNACLFCDRSRRWVEYKCSASTKCSPTKLKCVSRKTSDCIEKCDVLKPDPNGQWDQASCTSGPSNQGATCSLTCNTNYQLKGSAVIKCTQFGWNSTNSNLIPSCLSVQCYSQVIGKALQTSLDQCAGMLFVMDESGSIGSTDFDKSRSFVKDVVNHFTLSSSRTGGLITFDSSQRQQIPLNQANTYNFKVGVDKIVYQGGGTRVLEALQVAHSVINNQYNNRCYVVILITDGNSENDAVPAANALKAAKHPVFAIAVGAPNSLSYVESLASMDSNGVKHFFYSRNFNILAEIGKYLNAPPPPVVPGSIPPCGP